MLIELATVLSLFCGVDYSGALKDQCVKQTKECIEKSVPKNKSDNQVLKKQVVFKCFKAGTVKN